MNTSGEQRKSYGTLPGSKTLPEIPRSNSGPGTTVSLPRTTLTSDTSVKVVEPNDPSDAVRDLMSRLPDAPVKPGKTTETVTKTTYTETTVRRVTDNKFKPLVIEVGLNLTPECA